MTIDGLKPADMQAIRNAYVVNRDVAASLERAKACEFDCGELDERCQHAKRVMDSIMAIYGPHFPPSKVSG